VVAFEDFQKYSPRPGLTEISVDSVGTKTLSELKTLSAGEASNWVGVCDNLVWFAQALDPDTGRIKYYSSDGDLIYFFSPGNKNCLKYMQAPGKKLELVGTEVINFKKDEGDSKMAEPIGLKDLLGGIGGPEADKGGSMRNFDEVPSGSEGGKVSAEKKALKDTMAKIKNEARTYGTNDDISLLRQAWAKVAEHVFWITPNDARDSIGATKIPVPPDKRELVPNAPEQVRIQFSRDAKSVDSQFIKQVYKIQAKRSKPGKPVGAVIRVPMYLKGKSVQEYFQKISLDGPKTPEEGMAALEILTFSDYEQKLTLVGGTIREASETHGGAPSEIMINYTIAKARAKADSAGLAVNSGTTFVKKFARVGGGNKTVLTNSNYFPLTTYETYDIYGVMDQSLVDKLNTSCFESLMNGGKSTPAKARLLVQEQQGNIRQDGDRITSKYITNDADRIKLEVTEFFNKDKVRDTIRIPLKVRKEKSDGTFGALGFVKYSVLADSKKLDDQEYFAKTSLGNHQFDHLISLVSPDFLNPTTLKIFKRGGGGGGISKSLDALQARALLKSKILGTGFADFEVQGLKVAQ
jgi:hypothetical protein